MVISNQDKRHIQRAIRLAALSTERQRHGCVVAKSGSVVSVGVNTFRNDPQNVETPKQQASYHAERNAITYKAVERTTVYVARIRKDGTPAYSAPCVYCLDELSAALVKRVVWTTDQADVYGEYYF